MSGAWGLLPVTFVLSLSSLSELDVVGTFWLVISAGEIRDMCNDQLKLTGLTWITG